MATLAATRFPRARMLIAGILLGMLALASFRVTRFAVPPSVGVDAPFYSAVLMVLGGSRGIIAEILWWRIGDLQKQNRFAELVPLTDLLVALEPSSADARAYNAWNLAYNISVAHQDPAERWQWVCKGLDLLERGLDIAPTSEVLLRQMGWFWEDKIGGNLDTAADYYRTQIGTRAIPADAAAFETTCRVKADWNDPRVRALYWYSRAGATYDTLRVLTAILNWAETPEYIPLFVQVARQAIGDLAPQQVAQVRHVAASLNRAFPNQPELVLFLQELNYDSSHR